MSQFLTEAGQIEDISLQMRDMKVPLHDNYVARVNVPYKQRPYRRPYRSDKEHIPVLCRHRGYDRKHGKLEDCPAYGKTCYRCQKLNHFASVCKADRLKKAKRVHNNEGTDRANKTYETDTSESSDDHFRCATLRRTTLRLLRHFVESFCRITSSSKSSFVECIFVEYDTLSKFSVDHNISWTPCSVLFYSVITSCQ